MPLKTYGRKMANPRIKKSKEDRNCGPLGRYTQWKRWKDDPENPKPTILPYRKFGSNIFKPLIIRKKRRLQVSKEELIDYFGL